MTFCFSLAFPGRFGLLDELYIRERCRGQGLGRRAEALATTICQDEGMSALRLAVGNDQSRGRVAFLTTGLPRGTAHADDEMVVTALHPPRTQRHTEEKQVGEPVARV